MTTESRLGALEGTTAEHAAAIAGLRDDLRGGLADVRTEIAALRTDMRTEISAVRAEVQAVNARFDRLILALMGAGVTIGVAQVGVIITVVLRT